MLRKIIRFVLVLLLLAGLGKIFFFSGVASEEIIPFTFKKAKEPGYVWASAGAHYARGAVGNFFLGNHYRNVWTTPIKVPVLDLSKIDGGLTVTKLGGGQQTVSLTLTGKTGQIYSLRSLDKDPVGVLSKFWQKTIITDLVRDQIAASHPYAALVVAKLGVAANITFTNPRVVFISPDDLHFKKYKNKVGGKLFLFEEKYSHYSPVVAADSAVVSVLGSVEMLDKRYRYQNHTIDQHTFAKCRLFDLLVGDWDRHEGQWNWATFLNGTDYIYKPMPKDRDQAFSQYHDGVIPWLLTRNYALRKLGNFDAEIKDVYAYAINAAFLDERALNSVTKAEFIMIARELQSTLTDAVINTAVRQLPPEIYALTGVEIAQKLKSRRRQLVEIAEKYYEILAAQPVIAGTDDRDKFEVKRIDNKTTEVKIYQISGSDSVGKLTYQRIFKSSETENITLHGLAGNDIFIVTGKVKTGILVKIVSGLGADYIKDDSEVSQGRRKTRIYDTRLGNHIVFGKETKDKTTNDISVHNYDREGY